MIKQINIDGKIHNRFDIWSENVITGEKKQLGYAENTILDGYWSKVNVSMGYGVNDCPTLIRAAVGRGTGVLSPSRTSLFSQIAIFALTPAQGSQPSPVYSANTVSITRYGVRAENEDVGEFYTEIGVGTSASATGGYALVSHALILDMNGNPISIEKTDVEIITFYCTWFLHIPSTSFYGGSIFLQSIAHSLFRTMLGFFNSSSAPKEDFRYYAGFPIGFRNGLSATNNNDNLFSDQMMANVSWNASTKTMTWSARLAVGENPASVDAIGINGIWHIRYSTLQFYPNFPWMNFNPALVWHPDTNILGEVLGNGDGLISSFITTWALAKNATVKVDGVAVSSANVEVIEYMPPLTALLQADYLMFYDYTVNAYFNPFHSVMGIESIYGRYFKISVSQNGIDWVVVATQAASSNVTREIASEYRKYKYWKREDNGGTSAIEKLLYDVEDASGLHNVVFDSPPGLITEESVGTGDDLEVDFTLGHIPITGSLVVKIDGVETTDYTLSDDIITFNTAPTTGDIITADYRYACTVTIDYTTPIILKSTNYVFDINLQMIFGEYVPG